MSDGGCGTGTLSSLHGSSWGLCTKNFHILLGILTFLHSANSVSIPSKSWNPEVHINESMSSAESTRSYPTLQESRMRRKQFVWWQNARKKRKVYGTWVATERNFSWLMFLMGGVLPDLPLLQTVPVQSQQRNLRCSGSRCTSFCDWVPARTHTAD